jgi:hypothetical protein
MSLFVEITSEEKKCKVIINLDMVLEIAPLIAGGCVLSFNDSASVNGVRTLKVKEDYEQFKQFAMQTVTADDIQKRFPKKDKPVSVVKPQEEGKGVELEVPVFGEKK